MRKATNCHQYHKAGMATLMLQSTTRAVDDENNEHRSSMILDKGVSLPSALQWRSSDDLIGLLTILKSWKEKRLCFVFSLMKQLRRH